jgi:hypothetical protein
MSFLTERTTTIALSHMRILTKAIFVLKCLPQKADLILVQAFFRPKSIFLCKKTEPTQKHPKLGKKTE